MINKISFFSSWVSSICPQPVLTLRQALVQAAAFNPLGQKKAGISKARLWSCPVWARLGRARPAPPWHPWGCRDVQGSAPQPGWLCSLFPADLILQQEQSASGYLHWYSGFGMDVDGLFMEFCLFFQAGFGVWWNPCEFRINPCPNAVIPSMPL